MAGTTTNYGFPYPTSTDNVSDGAAKIQDLAQSIEDFIDGSEGLNKLWDIKVDTTDATTYTRSGTTTFGAFTSGPTYTFTTGKSGLFQVILTANFNNTTTAANGMALAYDISGGLYTAALGEAQTVTSRGGATLMRFHDGTPSTSYTITPQARTISSTGTLTLYNHNIQVITYG
jgi:hypothetical protein